MPLRDRSDTWASRRDGTLLGVLALLSLGLYVSFLLGALGRPSPVTLPGLPEETMEALLAHALPLLLLYGLAVLLVLRRPTGPLSLILVGAAAFRLVLLFSPPVLSDDIYRYVWDARVQAAGISPYLHPPRAEALAPLRDETIWPRINRPHAPTIYPPGAQLLFRAVRFAAPDSVLGMKAAMVFFDLVAIALLVLLLRQQGQDPRRVLLYAWHPLPVFELSGSGHLDALMIPFVLLTLLFTWSNRTLRAGLALGAAAAILLYPSLLVPVLLRRGGLRFILAFAAVLGGAYLLFLPGAGLKVLGYLPQYLSDPYEVHNASISLLGMLTLGGVSAGTMRAVSVIGGLILAALALGILRRPPAEPAQEVGRALGLVAIFTLMAHTVHPWLLVWVLPLLCLRPDPAWLYLSGAVGLSYLKYVPIPQPMLTAILLVEYLPFVLLLAWGRWRLRTPHLAPAPLLEETR